MKKWLNHVSVCYLYSVLLYIVVDFEVVRTVGIMMNFGLAYLTKKETKE